MKPKIRITSLLLAICLVVGLMPTAAFAARSDTGKAIQLGTSGISGYDSGYDYIYYGKWDSNPIKWRVLDDQTNTGESGLFLLTDKLLGTGNDGSVYFSYSANSNVWQNSTAQAWCKDFAGESGAAENVTDAFTGAELGAILATTKSDRDFTSSTYSVPFPASENILNGDKVFFLSAEESENRVYGFTNDSARVAYYGTSAGVWWLRSPYAYDAAYYAGAVYRDGAVLTRSVGNLWAARPAFNLNLNSVLFTSAAVGGKISAASGGGTGGEAAGAIFEIGDYNGNEWKLTLKDTSRNFSVTDTTAATGKPGDTVTLTYSGATVGTNEYISVMIADSSGNATHYGRIMKPTYAAGTVNITIPSGLADGTYTLNVFSEQYNGDYKTDYASAFAIVALTVDTVDNPPTLSTGSATRESETNATVKFTSSEAGAYYYAVVEKGATAPTIYTTAAGTACTNGENTISLTSLSGTAAKDIYIVAKDAAGNVSSPLKVEIPAYVAPVYSISADTAVLNFGSVQTGYTTTAAKTVTITNAGNQQITLMQPTASNYTVGGLSKTTLAAGGMATFTVQPKGGLAAGTYNETITVQGENGGNYTNTISIQANFAVSAPSTGGGDDGPTYYKLTFETNGGSSIRAVRATYGRTIDLTDYTPTREGYDFNGWYSDKALTQKITTIKLNGNKTVYAGWTERSSGTSTNPGQDNPNTGAGNPFTDVKETDWFFDDVMFVYEKDLMLGTSNTTFSPYGNTSRAMVSMVLWRLDGSPKQEGDAPFTDTKSGAWYNEAIKWAVDHGVAEGYGGGLFGPDDNITREQLAAFFYRYAEYKGYDLSPTNDLSAFTDADSVSVWAQDAMKWAIGSGLITGRDNGHIDPQAAATRAEFAAILHRFIEKYGFEEKTTYTGLTGWVDPNSSYLEVPKTGDSTPSMTDKLKPPTPTPA